MNLSHRVRVDGGINDETGVAGTRDRADIFIAGTSASVVRDLKSAVTQLRRSVSEAVPS